MRAVTYAPPILRSSFTQDLTRSKLSVSVMSNTSSAAAAAPDDAGEPSRSTHVVLIDASRQRTCVHPTASSSTALHEPRCGVRAAGCTLHARIKWWIGAHHRRHGSKWGPARGSAPAQQYPAPNAVQRCEFRLLASRVGARGAHASKRQQPRGMKVAAERARAQIASAMVAPPSSTTRLLRYEACTWGVRRECLKQTPDSGARATQTPSVCAPPRKAKRAWPDIAGAEHAGRGAEAGPSCAEERVCGRVGARAARLCGDGALGWWRAARR